MLAKLMMVVTSAGLAFALYIPITHPVPSNHTRQYTVTPVTPHLSQSPPQQAGEQIKVFATRAEPSYGISGGAIGGIIAGVVLGTILLVFLIVKLRQSSQNRSHPSQSGFPLGLPRALKPNHVPHQYATPYAAPPPAYPVYQQQSYYPAGIVQQHGQVQMPQTVHLGTRGSYFMSSEQPEERGVRFGPVGVRRYGT